MCYAGRSYIFWVPTIKFKLCLYIYRYIICNGCIHVIVYRKNRGFKICLQQKKTVKKVIDLYDQSCKNPQIYPPKGTLDTDPQKNADLCPDTEGQKYANPCGSGSSPLLICIEWRLQFKLCFIRVNHDMIWLLSCLNKYYVVLQMLNRDVLEFHEVDIPEISKLNVSNSLEE